MKDVPKIGRCPRLARFVVLTTVVICIYLATTALIAQPSRAADDLPNFQKVSASIYRGGQPSREGLRKLKSLGIKTIISFRTSHKVSEQEKSDAQALGLKYVDMRMGLIHSPSDRKVSEFLNVVNDDKAQPVFVHCQLGSDRTGTMIGIYRVAVDGWTAKDAYSEMLTYGFHRPYFWLTDTVFDYEEALELQKASSGFD